MQRIILIRHGETLWAKEGRHTGRTDIKLTDEGRKQAELLSLSSFSPAIVFCSPLERAKQTCMLSGMNMEKVIITPLLYEWDYGSYEGLTSTEIFKENPSWNVFFHGAPNGESPADITKRIKEFFLHIEGIEGDIFVFSSGHLLRALAAIWIGAPLHLGANLQLSVASISILSKEHQFKTILLWNKTERK